MTNFEILLSYLEKNFPKQHTCLLAQRNENGWDGLTVEECINKYGDDPWPAVYEYVGINCYGCTVQDWDEVLDAISGKTWSELK